MPVPENITPAEMRGLPAQSCVECAKSGHIGQRAVERIDGIYLCVYCRDGDPCPGCNSKAKIAQPQTNRNDKGRVTLQNIVDEFEGETSATVKNREFKKVNGIQVRYPDETEINLRFRRRSRNDMLADTIKLVESSPTGHAELTIPAGMKGHSFQSLLARFVKQKKKRYTVHLDSKNKTVVVSNAQLHRAL